MGGSGWPRHWAPVDKRPGWLGEGVTIIDGSESEAESDQEAAERELVKGLGVLGPGLKVEPPVVAASEPIEPDDVTNPPPVEWDGLDDIEMEDLEQIAVAAEEKLNPGHQSNGPVQPVVVDLVDTPSPPTTLAPRKILVLESPNEQVHIAQNNSKSSPLAAKPGETRLPQPMKTRALTLHQDHNDALSLDKETARAKTVQFLTPRIPASERFSLGPVPSKPSRRTATTLAPLPMWRALCVPTVASPKEPERLKPIEQTKVVKERPVLIASMDGSVESPLPENGAFLESSSLAVPGGSAKLIACFLADVDAEVDGSAVHVEEIPAARAKVVAMSAIPLSPLVAAVLAKDDRPKTLYTHQARAIQAVQRGRNVVVATPTASGKSTCFVAPVLEMLLDGQSKQERNGRALLLFPLKALAQDQLQKFRTYIADAKPKRPIYVESYDGDTPQKERSDIRKRASVVLTNPDMVHTGLLRNHNMWAHFFQQLRYVVLDESHSYCGVFGAHVSCIIKRLRTICSYYSSDPIFILCSATIADPREHAMKLTGLDFTLVGPEDNGAPRGTRTMLFWSPPSLDGGSQSGRLATEECAQIVAKLMAVGLRTVAFLRSRKATELLCSRTKDMLAKRDCSDLVDRIEPYRGGYTPTERREIERRLFNGDLMAVTSTSALELGVDVGGLDATLLHGFPDSIASLWQQAGRSGRGAQPCITIMVGTDEVLDQYYMKHPQDLLAMRFEPATLDPENPVILRNHLQRALKEHPLSSQQVSRIYGKSALKVLKELEFNNVVRKTGSGDLDSWAFAGANPPDFSIRAAVDEKYVMLQKNSGDVVEEIALSSAAQECHKGAVYIHRGTAFLVIKVDHEMKTATVIVPGNMKFYTVADVTISVEIVKSVEKWRVKRTAVFIGEVSVTKEVTTYRKFNIQTDQRVGSVFDTVFPKYTYSTTGLWFSVSFQVFDEFCARLNMNPSSFADSLSGLACICARVVPLTALCSRVDVGGASTGARAFLMEDAAGAETVPMVILFDSSEGGNGVCKALRDQVDTLWQRALEVVSNCACDDGCPSCVMKRGYEWDKKGTKILLECLISNGKGKDNT